MRSLRFNAIIDGRGVPVRISKVQSKRMFRVYWEVSDKKNETVYAQSDNTNVLEYYEGMEMPLILHETTIKLIDQYFGSVRAKMKIDEDDYDDYDDD